MSRAVEFAVELGVTRAIIEGDSETKCNELSNPSPSLALHGLLIKDAQQLATAFTNIIFSHVCCQGNMVAHSLARRAILNQNLIIWMEEVPPDIYQFVKDDLRALVLLIKVYALFLKKKKKKL